MANILRRGRHTEILITGVEPIFLGEYYRLHLRAEDIIVGPTLIMPTLAFRHEIDTLAVNEMAKYRLKTDRLH